MKNLIISIVLIFNSIIIYSENNTINYPVKRPSTPDAAAIAKYGDYPVSLHTGLVNISIPLFDINTKRIKIPVNISYHSAGIRVDEIASNVGLGWIININGCINRTLRGKKDDNVTKYYLENELKSYSNSVLNSTAINLLGGSLSYDTESDIYTYSFNGISGKFYYDSKKKIINTSSEGIKIEGNYDSGFIITTAEGIEYVFSKKEYSGNLINSAEYISAWFLSQINDKIYNEQVNFEYDINTASTSNIYPNESGFYYNNIEDRNLYGSLKESNEYIYQTSTGSPKLNKITFPDGFVNLVYSNDRQDLNFYRIDSVELRNKSNELIK